jgi:hypothetical protein
MTPRPPFRSRTQAARTLADVTILAGNDEIQAQPDVITTWAAVPVLSVKEELAKIKDRLASKAGPPGDEPAHDR